MPMISDHDPRWRAVRLENEQSVRYLEKLLRAGWYLMRLDVDGMATMSFWVPPKPLVALPGKIMVRASTQDNLSVIVLRKGKIRDRQKIVAMYRDESGRLDMSVGRSPGPEWEKFENVWTEDMGIVVFYEKIGPEW